MTRFKTTITPHDLEPEILAGHDHFEIVRDGKIQGTYNRPVDMDEYALSNELFSYCVDIARGTNRFLTDMKIIF